MKRSRALRPFVAALLMALLAVACGGDDSTTESADSESTEGTAAETTVETFTEEELTITFNMAGAMTYAPLMLAEDLGFFEDEGLTIKSFNVGEAGMDNAQAVMAGALDAGGVSGHTVLQALAQGANTKAVSIFAGGADPLAIIVQPELGITDPADFAGLRIGYEQGGLIQQMVYTLLDAEGIPLDKVELIAVPAADMPAAMEAGTVDAVIVYEPFASAIEAGGSGTIIGRMSEYVDEVPRYIFMNEEFMKNRPEAALRFLRALHRGMQYIRETDPAELGVLLAPRFEGTPAESIAFQIALYTWDPRITDKTRELLASDLKFLIKIDRIEDPNVDPNDAFDLRFQEQLVKDNPELYEDIE